MKITDLKPNEVIHCKTQAEAVRICEMMHKVGLSWGSGDSYAEQTNWEIYERKMCYCPSEGCYADREYFEEDGVYTVYPSELLQDETETSDEITEDGLLLRGFEATDVTMEMEKKKSHSIISIRVELLENSGVRVRIFEYFDPGMPYYIPIANCKTLSDVDHLIRLLGI